MPVLLRAPGAAAAAAAVPVGGVRPSKLLLQVLSTKEPKGLDATLGVACALHRGPSRRRPKQRAEETRALDFDDVVVAMAETLVVGSRTTTTAATATRRRSLDRLPVSPRRRRSRPAVHPSEGRHRRSSSGDPGARGTQRSLRRRRRWPSERQHRGPPGGDTGGEARLSLGRPCSAPSS